MLTSATHLLSSEGVHAYTLRWTLKRQFKSENQGSKEGHFQSYIFTWNSLSGEKINLSDSKNALFNIERKSLLNYHLQLLCPHGFNGSFVWSEHCRKRLGLIFRHNRQGVFCYCAHCDYIPMCWTLLSHGIYLIW